MGELVKSSNAIFSLKDLLPVSLMSGFLKRTPEMCTVLSESDVT